MIFDRDQHGHTILRPVADGAYPGIRRAVHRAPRRLADMTIARAFNDGWYEGAMGHGCQTIREAETRHPDWTAAEITAHLNGVTDGEASDTFRRDGAR